MRTAGEGLGYVREALRVDDVPVQYVELGVTHDVDVLLDDRQRVPVPARVDERGTEPETRRVLDARLVHHKLFVRFLRRRDLRQELGERFQAPQRTKDRVRLQLHLPRLVRVRRVEGVRLVHVRAKFRGRRRDSHGDTIDRRRFHRRSGVRVDEREGLVPGESVEFGVVGGGWRVDGGDEI